MFSLLAQIAPQRSTQYSALALALAPAELRLSPIGRNISEMAPVQLGGQSFLQMALREPPQPTDLPELGALAMTSALFEWRATLGGEHGPWLKPIETHFAPALPQDLLMTRRYKGKTNELFTLFLCNVVRWCSGFASEPWRTLRLLDPLAGGGTTLFAGLVLGADVIGVEQSDADVESTVAFIKQYTREQALPMQVKEERLKQVGKRWQFALGVGNQHCVLARGDTAKAPQLLASLKRPHVLVADLPYGIQHKGELLGLLATALPAWASLLPAGGAMALAWESTRFDRTEMLAAIQNCLGAGWQVLHGAPYDQMAHRVDRVIKQRDVVLVRKQ
jgi:hypothetical protein